jgi:formimidoylglutamate deiminase
MNPALFWAPQAWIGGRWQHHVCMEVDQQGRWADITPGQHSAPQHARVLSGPVLPALVNAHSHAFQRAFVGLAEQRENESDDFWSWRDRMYGVALRITPSQLQAIAAQLYAELLCGGYTQVCEFHYLHQRQDGQPYDDPATLAWSLADAAQDSGVGLTLLPVLYERAGFLQHTLRADQRRFASSPTLVARLAQDIASVRRPLVNTGIAVHSLRAARPTAMRTLLDAYAGHDGPIHIHVAEQMQEVRDCEAALGVRPIEWLCRNQALDARWQLVHATHASQAEIDRVAEAGAGVVLCPGTEANLGDGLADLEAWLTAGVPLSIGSDSHVLRNWPEELRWLEYGQRLKLQRRNVAAAPTLGYASTAARLFEAALAGGKNAAAADHSGITRGARADALVLNPQAAGLLGVAPVHTLDALVFAGAPKGIDSVYVAGQCVVTQGRHVREDSIARRFAHAMGELWESGTNA